MEKINYVCRKKLAGVWNGFKPPKYLTSGDRIDITVEGIGTLTNMVK